MPELLLDEQRVGVPQTVQLQLRQTRPARSALNERPRALMVNLLPRSLGHIAGERSAVRNSSPPPVHQC
jgi:hypothetical protein